MTILLLETVDEEANALLQDYAKVILSPTPNAHDHDLPFDEITAIVTRGMGQLDRALIERCPSLEVVARCGAGLNNLDLIAANENNIPVIHAPGVNATAIAEHSLMLMLMSVRKGYEAALNVKRDNWEYRNDFAGDDLFGKKVCIVGSGNIGSKTAKLCEAFSMNVRICSRNGQGLDGLAKSLERELVDCDILSIHMPLTSETEHYFDQNWLSKLPYGAAVINTARAQLIDPKAALAMLKSGQISAYCADLIEGDQSSETNELISHPNSIITPHVAAMTKGTYLEMCLFTCENVVNYLTNKNCDPRSIYTGGLS